MSATARTPYSKTSANSYLACGGLTALESGDIEAGPVWAGQVQRLIHDIPTCAQLLEGIIGEASVLIRNRLTDWLSDNS